MNDFIRKINRTLSAYLPPASKTIFVINVAVFIVLYLMSIEWPALLERLIPWIAETPELAIGRLCVWQFVTYMFVHVDFDHVLFNMIVFWFLAPPLEIRLGRRAFWRFYLMCGVGAGILQAVLSLTLGYHAPEAPNTNLLGASGAILALMLAYAAYWPEQVVLVWFVFPMKIKYLMVLVIVTELAFSAANSAGYVHDHISHLTHVAGLLVGYAWMAIYHRDWDLRHWRWQQ